MEFVQFISFSEGIDVRQFGTLQAHKDSILLTQKITNQYGLRSVHYCATEYWTDVPFDMKLSPPVNIFHKNVNICLLTFKKLITTFLQLCGNI